METIEEQPKGEMSISPTPSPENLRICLVGDVVNDAATVEAARSFGVPVITSETAEEIISDPDWRTHFVLKDFEGPVFDAIHRTKQCILGPPALRHAAEMKDGLIHHARPIYNYSMRGVVTCFTGIRKKDELTRLVNLIHSMGGCIRKDMNMKITHLISTHSGGDKYQYAKTFRLTVVRPAWVYAAWERRDELKFRAITEEFSKEHKLRAFEGQKICFFGFPADEQQHMIDVLKSNGGVPTELDDPECTHVVMPNTGGYFLENITTNSSTPKLLSTNTEPQLTNSPHYLNFNNNPNLNPIEEMAVDAEEGSAATAAVAVTCTMANKENNNESKIEDDDDEDLPANLLMNYGIYTKRSVLKLPLPDIPDEDETSPMHLNDLNDFDAKASTPMLLKYGERSLTNVDVVDFRPHDNASATADDESAAEQMFHQINASKTCREICFDTPIKQNPNDSSFLQDPNTLADLFKTPRAYKTQAQTPKHCPKSLFTSPTGNRESLTSATSPMHQPQSLLATSTHSSIAPIAEQDQFMIDESLAELKRKRDSFDNVSLMSTDSFALPNSSKKPKLIRTGSITRSLKRSMSFIADRTPLSKVLGSRRNSIALDASTHANYADYNDGNDSICSMASMASITSMANSTLNESTRKPLKQKLRNMRDSIITRGGHKKDKQHTTAMVLETPERDDDLVPFETLISDGFKTPKAPSKQSVSSSKSATPKAARKSFSIGLKTLSESARRTSLGFFGNSSTTPTTTFNTNKKTFSPIKSIQQQQKLTSNQEISITVTNQVATNAAPQKISQNSQDTIKIEDTTNASATFAAQVCTERNSQNKSSQFYTDNDVGRSRMVVDEHTTQAKPEPKNNRTHILKSDWFWYTIQNGYADENDYLFGDYLDSIANTPCSDRRESLPISFNKRKRKRFSQRLQLEGTPLGSGKRRSSVSDAGLLSVSSSFFDCTTSPDKLENGKLLVEPETSICDQTPAKKSMRYNHFMDFYSTESNYVGILDTIVNLFQNPLEEIAENNDALLNKSEIRAIFGNFSPIHQVHKSMLERLRVIQSKWTEECLIGDIILQHRESLMKAYPPYVNFFEQMKETLQQCDKENPRFHAFLKINQTKPECGRQSLQDLMIRPVQRLPSISLLLNDILKHTNKINPDYTRLEEALKSIKEVMMHINEDKRKTESRMAIFDIFNDIEGCPPHLVSSNRRLISKCEVTELSDNLSSRGDSLMLYLFSDTIEVCKKRSRGFNTAKSPNSTKSHKHVKLMPLNTIRFVIDITDSPRAFALLCRQDKEKLHCFSLIDEEVDKVVYLKLLCKQMAEHACRTDTDKPLLCRTSQELEVDISDVNLSTLSKAFKLAARTRLKVGRAFSFNKTPSKLKRAVSTMMTSPFGSTNSLTPASQLAQMRLASCTNINEVGGEGDSRSSSPSTQSDVLLPPLSVQPTRKNKAATLAGGGMGIGRM